MVVEEKKHRVSGSTALAPQRKAVPKKRAKVKPRKRKKSNNKKKILITLKVGATIVITGFICFTMLYRYSLIYTNQKQLISLQGEISTIKEKNEELKVNLLKLNNISAVEQSATKDLNMIAPDSSNVAYYNLEKTSPKDENTNKKGTVALLVDKLKNILFN